MNSFLVYLCLFYGAASLGMLYLWWGIVKRLRQRFLRDALLGLCAVVFFVPWFAVPNQADLAPAFFIMLHDLFFPGAVGAGQTFGVLFVSYLAFLLILAFCYWIVRRIRLHSNQT